MKKFISISPFIGLFLLILIHPLVSAIELQKYFCLIAFILGFTVWKYFKAESRFRFSYLDWPWVILLIYSLLSFFWSTDPALNWNVSFYYLLLLIGTLIIRQVELSNQNFKRFQQLLSLLFSVLFLQCVVFIGITYFAESPLIIDLTSGSFGNIARLFRLPPKELKIYLDTINSWNYLLGRNWNFICLYYLALLPFLMFKKGSSLLLGAFKMLACLLGLLLIYKSRCLGAALILGAFAFLSIGFSLKERSSKDSSKKMIGRILGSFVLIFTSLIFYNWSTVDGFISGIDEMRWYQVKKSVELFWSSNAIGIGSGNWHLHAYNEPLQNIAGLDSTVVFQRLYNHNLPSTILAELGVVGLGAFLFPFIALFYYSFKKIKKLNGFDKACLMSVIVFILGCNFYGAQSMNIHFFSEINLVVWIAFGLLSNKVFPVHHQSSTHYFWIVLLSILAVSWLSFYHFSKTNYLNALATKKYYPVHYFDYIHKDKWIGKVEFQVNNDKVIKKIEEQFNPNFLSSFYNHDLLPLRLGTLSYLNKDFEKAKKWFDIGLQKAPNNDLVLMNLSNYELRINKDLNKAKEYADQVYQRQNNHEGANILMAEILIDKNDLDKAVEHLQSINPYQTRYANYVRILMAEIYFKKGEYDSAKRELEKVNDYLPSIKDLKTNLESQFPTKKRIN